MLALWRRLPSKSALFVLLTITCLLQLVPRAVHAVRISVVEYPLPGGKPVAQRGSAFNFRPLSVLSDYAESRLYTCWTNEDLTVYVSIFDSDSLALIEHKMITTDAHCADLHAHEDGSFAVFTRRRADTRNDEGVLRIYERSGSLRGSVTFPEEDIVGLEPRIAFSNDPDTPYYAVFYKDIYGGHGVSAARFVTATEPRLLEPDEYSPAGISASLANFCSHSLEERVVWNDAANEWAFLCRSDFYPQQGFSLWANGFRAYVRAPPCTLEGTTNHASDTGELFTDGGNGYVMSLTNVNRELPEVTVCQDTDAEDLIADLAWMHVVPCETCDNGFQLTSVFLTDTPDIVEQAPTNVPIGNSGNHLVVFKRSGNEAFAMVVDNDGNIIEIEERIDDRATFSGRENFVPLPNGDVFYAYFWDTYHNGSIQNQARNGGDMKLVKIGPGTQSDVGATQSCVDMTGWDPAEFEERGCFGDSDDNGFGVLNSVRSDFFSLSTQMTYETCSEYCWRYKYFGIRGHNMCFCGDNEDYDRNGVSFQCIASCDGNTSLACGGSWKIRVFEHLTFESRPRNETECPLTIFGAEDGDAATRIHLYWNIATIACSLVLLQGLAIL